MFSLWRAVLATISLVGLVEAHTVITYPGWRGDNLITNDTFPYGMQWMYPCEFEIFYFQGSHVNALVMYIDAHG
jgi:hypothetical protein